MLRYLTHRTVYVLSEKRLDSGAQCFASTKYGSSAILAFRIRVIAHVGARSGTIHYLHRLTVPRSVNPMNAYLWAQEHLVVREPGPDMVTDQYDVVTSAPGVVLLERE